MRPQMTIVALLLPLFAAAAPPPGAPAAPPAAAPAPRSAPVAPPAAAPAPPGAATPLEELARRVRPSVVEVLGTVEGSGDTSFGAGFAAGAPGLVVTSAHVLRGVRRPLVRTYEGAVFASVEALIEDEPSDVAVLRVVGLAAAPLPLAAASPPVGARVVAVGHPRGYDFTVSDGIVSARRRLDERGPELVQVTAPISPGSSGGPLLDVEGRVVGVSSLTLSEGQNINFAVPVEVVRPLLVKAEEIDRAAAGSPETAPPEALAREMRRRREAGDLARADELARRALAAQPRSPAILREAAEIAWSRGAYAAVEELVGRALALDPQDGAALQTRGALRAQQGRCAEAEADSRAALARGLPPATEAEARAVLAECLGRAGKTDEALAEIGRALADPGVAAVPDYHALRAFLLDAAGRGEEADREALTALSLARWEPMTLAALRERGLPRLLAVESKRVERSGAAVVVRGVLRNRGPVPLGEIDVAAEARDPSGAVVATATARLAPPRLVPGQTGAFRIELEDVPPDAGEIVVRVVDYKP